MNDETKTIKRAKDGGKIRFINPVALINSVFKTIFYIFFLILVAGILFGMGFIIGTFTFILSGNDIILEFMAEILKRIIELKSYFTI